MGAIVILACYSQMTTGLGRWLPRNIKVLAKKSPANRALRISEEECRADIDSGFRFKRTGIPSKGLLDRELGGAEAARRVAGTQREHVEDARCCRHAVVYAQQLDFSSAASVGAQHAP